MSGFEVREPWDGEWGLPNEYGNFSGIVGTLQYEKADFSFLLTPLPVRLLGMDIGAVFIEDPFMILSHEPGPLPRSLAIVAPFGDTVWMGFVISGFVYGIGLWLMDRGWASFFKEKAMGLSYSLFYILRILMEDPPSFIPRQLSVQFFISWWALVSFVLISAYKSALISYLTVIKTYDAINSFEDLWKRKDMTWGSIYMSESGASYLYLVTNPNPVIRKVAAKILTLDSDAHLERVLGGRYAYITRNSWALTDLLRIEIENLPIHTSISKYPVSCGYTWGFRKGSPLRAPIDKLQRRLVETGLTKIWLREIVTKIAVKVRQTSKKLQSTVTTAGQGQNRALTMEHLQGAFLLLSIGFGVALAVLVFEVIRYRCSSKNAPCSSD
ncbi:glutamate receptor ionotropic, delta-2-like [Macrobrachium rosenbergii]|uniref:glutamate receptor ionotropic, delta-2-like n=1 Tax=Macrobrachium rosenbergii TaxID=79674 RepID=UPI0034D5775B